MLREEILRKWKGCKEKFKSQQKFLKFLATNSFEETVLPMFPLGLEGCRQKLDRWTGADYRVKLDQHKSDFIEQQNNFGEISNEHLTLLAMVYTNEIDMFKELTQGWKKEKDAYARYRNAGDGPTIHEVDDW